MNNKANFLIISHFKRHQNIVKTVKETLRSDRYFKDKGQAFKNLL